MIIKLVRNFIKEYAIGTDDGMSDANNNPVVAFCITDTMGDPESCGYLIGISRMGMMAYDGVHIPAINLDLVKKGRVKVVGVDMV